MKVIGGVADADFCFDSPQWSAVSFRDYVHAGCSTDSNKVFDPAGGGAAFQKAENAWFDPARQGIDWTWGDWLFMDKSNVYGLGTNDNELVMFLGPIKREICLEINKRLGISVSTGAAYDPVPYDYVCCGWDWARQMGWGTAYDPVDSIGWDDPPDPTALAGKSTGCGVESSGARHYFYHVLLVR